MYEALFGSDTASLTCSDSDRGTASLCAADTASKRVNASVSDSVYVLNATNPAAGELVPSLALTVCEPVVDAGIVIEQLNPPLASEVQELGVVAWTELSYLTVIAFDAANPVPVTVTLLPTIPDVGFKEIRDVTVNGWVGWLGP